MRNEIPTVPDGVWESLAGTDRNSPPRLWPPTPKLCRCRRSSVVAAALRPAPLPAGPAGPFPAGRRAPSDPRAFLRPCTAASSYPLLRHLLLRRAARGSGIPNALSLLGSLALPPAVPPPPVKKRGEGAAGTPGPGASLLAFSLFQSSASEEGIT